MSRNSTGRVRGPIQLETGNCFHLFVWDVAECEGRQAVPQRTRVGGGGAAIMGEDRAAGQGGVQKHCICNC